MVAHGATRRGAMASRPAGFYRGNSPRTGRLTGDAGRSPRGLTRLLARPAILVPLAFAMLLQVMPGWPIAFAQSPGASAAHPIASAEPATIGMEERPETWPAGFLDDAHLYDVCFVNAQQGWAVGDRGVIWSTTDGGAHWSRQDSTVDCRLESIFFLDAQRGWAVGGHTVAYSHRSTGVVLRTEDGGAHWKRQSDELLPWLKGIHFRDRANGYAYGWPSTMFPSGLFQTTDGGFHWTSVGGSTPGWVRGEFDRRGNGLLIDRHGKLWQWVGGTLRASQGLGAETRWPVSALPGDAGDWLAIGNQGLLVRSVDRGRSWQEPAPSHASTAAGGSAEHWLREFDWQAVARQGSGIWVAGVPGTRILHSSDGGQTFDAHDTGQRLPLYAVDFADEQHGWAVGALGTILHSSDGGLTWQSQQGKERRLAALGVFARTDSVPWEVVSQLGAADGYRIGLEVFAPGSGHEPLIGRVSTAARLQEAAVAAGGVGANLLEGLPIPDSRLGWTESQLRDLWTAADATGMEDQLTEYLVRQIRMWQPEMLVSREPDAREAQASSDMDTPGAVDGTAFARADAAQEASAEGWEQLVRGLALRAAESAAGSDTRFRHLDAVGLPAWRVPRITTAAVERPAREGQAGGANEASRPRRNVLRDPGLQETRRGGYPVTAQRSVLGRGQSVGSLADRARSHLDRDYQAGEPRWTVRGLARLGDRATGDRATREPGLASPAEAVQAATRRSIETARETLRQQNQQLQQRKLIESLARSREVIDPALSAQLLHMASELEEGPRGELLFQMGSQFFRRGQSDQAFACWEPFQDSLRNHRLAEIARLRTFWYLASEEASMRWRLTGPRVTPGEESRVAQAALQVQEEASNVGPVADDLFDNSAAASSSTARNSVPGQRALLNESDRDPEEATRRKRLEQLVAFLQSHQTDVYFEPEVGYPLAAWQRRTDQTPLAVRFWRNQLSSRSDAHLLSSWSPSWASRELSLAQSTSTPAGAEKTADDTADDTGANTNTSAANAAVWSCPAIVAPPRLDGAIDDDPAWVGIEPRELQAERPTGPHPGTRIRFAHDDEFFYLAAYCPKSASAGSAAPQQDQPQAIARQRDRDLKGDRLEWFLDVDRDGLTHWQFTVDHRGWGRESLLDDLGWNPAWHIARGETAEAWMVEVAIPLRELTRGRATSGTAWCIGVQRVVPGVELQSWSTVAPIESHAREFGVLQFE